MDLSCTDSGRRTGGKFTIAKLSTSSPLTLFRNYMLVSFVPRTPDPGRDETRTPHAAVEHHSEHFLRIADIPCQCWEQKVDKCFCLASANIFL